MRKWSPEKVIEGNLKAFNTENQHCYMGVFHPDSAQISNTAMVTMNLFSTYDLKAKFTEPLRAEKTGRTAKVFFTQKTHNKNSAEFRNNVVKGYHEMKLNGDDRWRLTGTIINETKFLD